MQCVREHTHRTFAVCTAMIAHACTSTRNVMKYARCPVNAYNSARRDAYTHAYCAREFGSCDVYVQSIIKRGRSRRKLPRWTCYLAL